MFTPNADLYKDYLKKKYPMMPEEFLEQLVSAVNDERIGKILGVVGEDKADALYKLLSGHLKQSAQLGKLITPTQIAAKAGTKKYTQEQAREAILQILCEHFGITTNFVEGNTTLASDIDFVMGSKEHKGDWNESPHISEVMGENYAKAVDNAFEQLQSSIFQITGIEQKN